MISENRGSSLTKSTSNYMIPQFERPQGSAALKVCQWMASCRRQRHILEPTMETVAAIFTINYV